MLVTKKRFNRTVELLERDTRMVRDELWELRRSYWALLEHLGLQEVSLPPRRVMRKLGADDERGEHE